MLIKKIELATFLSSKLPAKIAQKLFLGVCAALLAKILPSALSRSLRQALVIQYRSTRACVRSLLGVVITARGPSLLNVSTEATSSWGEDFVWEEVFACGIFGGAEVW